MTDKEELKEIKKLADAMYYAAQYLTTDASRLHNAMDEYRKFIINEYHKEEPTIPDIVDEHFDEMLGEEPVSEDLKEAAMMHYKDVMERKIITGIETANMTSFKAGAKWQKEQFEKNRLAACDRQTEEEAEREQDFVMGIIENEHRKPTFNDAIKYGMRLQRENMMKDAVDAVVHIEAGNYPYIPQLELYDYDKDIPLANEGDRYKVILIKDGEL